MASSTNYRLLLLYLLGGWFAHFCSGQQTSNCPIREVCLGHMGSGDGASGSTVADILQDLHNDFCGCRAIDGNIHVVMGSNFPDLNTVSLNESNFTFFSEVTEVTGYILLQRIPTLTLLSFPKLRLIRGRQTSSGFALAIGSSNIMRLYMPRLTEITSGNVIFAQNIPPLCSAASVNWTDIISESGTYTGPTCAGQAPNCSKCASGYCWCDGDAGECCQTLSRTVCSCDHRCVGGSGGGGGGGIQCCNAACAAGCSGGNADQCHACRELNNNGKCVPSCPVEFIVENGVVTQNPEFRVEAGTQCIVPPCPEGLFRLGGVCLDQCPISTHQSVDRECVRCDGPCPRECPGGTVTEESDTFRSSLINCTIVTDNLHIGIPPITGFTNTTLDILNTIQEIRGTLYIERWSYETFPYLSNLRILGSNQTSQLQSLPSQCKNGSRVPYALYIANNPNLISIDLSSLREIRAGGFHLHNNPQLCLLGDLSSLVTNTSAPVCVTTQARRNRQQCVTSGVVCSGECADETMCWGTGADKCVSCRNFLYSPNNTCVSSCENTGTTQHYYGDRVSKQCRLCHPLCDGACSGEGPSNCSKCVSSSLFVNRSNVIECVGSTCPTGWYDGMMGECIQCFGGCGLEGCAGPLPYVNSSAGCKSCNSIIIDRQGEQVECRRQFNVCPDGYYVTRVEEPQGEIQTGTTLCKPCHPLCGLCLGPNDNECSRCVVASRMGRCVDMCDPSESLNNETRTCDPQPPTSAVTPVASIAGGVVGGVVLVLVIVSVVVLLLVCMCFRLGPFKSQIVDKNHNGMVGDNPMYGGREEFMLMTMERETLQPPKVPPNTNHLTIIAEDSLEFGKLLGSGAFGTVHEGYWQPDGDTQQYHVAIKVLKISSPSAEKELLQEGVVMAKMDHENVVRLYGVCMSKTLMLVSQFVPLGALLDHLKKFKDHLNAHTMLTYSYQIARGMGYLETHHLVHRDLAARNVLVQSHKKVKITDFGLTRLVDIGESHYQATNSKMPVRWLPLESISERIFTHKTDVWSFAVTLWEILTFGARPYQGKTPYQIVQMLKSGRRLEQPVTCTIDLYQLMLECWLLDPDSRPPFTELAERLREMANDPCRYILTVKDGSTGDYTMLPSNIIVEGDTAYETRPVGTLRMPTTAEPIEPYHSVATADIPAGYELPPDLPPEELKAAEAKQTQEYETPVGGSDPDPRYVKLNVGLSPSRSAEPSQQDPPLEGPHDYDDADEKLLMGPGGDDDYTVMSNPSHSLPPGQQPVLSINVDNYEQPYQPDTVGKELPNNHHCLASPYEVPADASFPVRNTLSRVPEANYEFPENPDTLGSPIHNYELPDNPVDQDHNYELPAADYEVPYTPTTNPPPADYELVGEPDPIERQPSPYELPMDGQPQLTPLIRQDQLS